MAMSRSTKVLAVIRSLLVVGAAGVLVVKAEQIRTGISGDALFSKSPAWTAIMLITPGSFFVALLILLPVFVFFTAHEIQSPEGTPMPWWAPVAFVFGLADPNWTVPRAVSVPLVVVMSVLGGFVTYTLLMGLIFGYFLK